VHMDGYVCDVNSHLSLSVFGEGKNKVQNNGTLSIFMNPYTGFCRCEDGFYPVVNETGCFLENLKGPCSDDHEVHVVDGVGVCSVRHIRES